jgi:3-oxoacyl-[acyl-carrier protein] reductase
MDISLSGKNALVGGSSAGIGRAVAIALSRLGASVTLLARTEEKLIAVKSELDSSQGQHHDYLVVDFSNAAELLGKLSALQQHKAYHILVNNTGGPPSGPIISAVPSEFLGAYHNHLLCNQLLAQALLPGMKQAGFGRIINIISTSVKEPIEGLGVSNTTRWAVAAWAKTWATEVAAWGITVNNVLPGFTRTGRLDEIIEKRAAMQGSKVSDMEEIFKKHVPAQRFAEPEEVANAVAFLASPAASYINGVNLPVDGGRTKSL